MHNSIFQISNSEKNFVGTGFVIDRDSTGVYVATCGHVINKCISNIFVEDQIAEILINKYDEDLDLGILYVPGIKSSPLPFSTSDINFETKGKVIGFSKMISDSKRETINDIKIKPGIEVTKKKTRRKVSTLKLYPKEPICNGYSGSPVICQESNMVIGIVNIQKGKDTNYAISSKHLCEIHKLTSLEHIAEASEIVPKKTLVTPILADDYLLIKSQFEKNLEGALRTFSTQPKVWVDPSLYHNEEVTNIEPNSNVKVNLADLVAMPRSIVIRAREQFGLTCLSHYFVKEAWDDIKPSLWLRLDAKDLKPFTQELKKRVLEQLELHKLSFEDIECVVLDEFSSKRKNASILLSKLCELFEETPVIIMMTVTENSLTSNKITMPSSKIFENLHLWALPREGVRCVVSEYNDKQYIGDENDVVAKVISDLDVLNIPRTPLNCLTILKISEFEFDDSPVNRSEMIKRVLFLLFNVDNIPNYKTRPDLKDTEFVLGYFCSQMLIKDEYYFTRQYFMKEMKYFCEEQEIELDVDVIFDVLYSNNILTGEGVIPPFITVVKSRELLSSYRQFLNRCYAANAHVRSVIVVRP